MSPLKTQQGPALAKPGPDAATDLKDAESSSQRTRMVRHPAAFASAYAPCGRRTLWSAAIRCPHCGGVHMSRTRELAQITGLRRTGCRPGAVVWVVVQRVYAPKADRLEVAS